MNDLLLSVSNQIVEKAPYTAALIQALDRIGAKLIQSDQDFLYGISERFFTYGIELSTKQLLRLEETYKLYVPKG